MDGRSFGQIEAAARSKLNDLGRTSFSGEKFSDSEINTIAAAISAAIKAYDEQKNRGNS